MKVTISLFIIFLFFGCGNSSDKDIDFVQIPDEYPPKKINLPLCDESNSKVLFIKNMKDWENINNKKKTIFCVKAENYQAKVIQLIQT